MVMIGVNQHKWHSFLVVTDGHMVMIGVNQYIYTILGGHRWSYGYD